MQIARNLSLSERTVMNGLGRTLSKLGVRNRTGAVLRYWSIDALKPTEPDVSSPTVKPEGRAFDWQPVLLDLQG
jgi:hypothetical protein